MVFNAGDLVSTYVELGPFGYYNVDKGSNALELNGSVIYRETDTYLIHLFNMDVLDHSIDFAFFIGQSTVDTYHIGKEWIYKAALWVKEDYLYKSESIQLYKASAGMQCAICIDYIPYTEPNVANGAFICRSCRLTRKYKVLPYLRQHNVDIESFYK